MPGPGQRRWDGEQEILDRIRGEEGHREIGPKIERLHREDLEAEYDRQRPTPPEIHREPVPEIRAP